jgi:hypothetical protein
MIALPKGCTASTPILCSVLTSRDTGGGEMTVQSLGDANRV